jgi:4-hydroxybenzoate polyprenyltransferase
MYAIQRICRMQRQCPDDERLPSDGRPLKDPGALPGVDPAAPSPVRELVRSLRLHQCVKNLIVFVPITLGGHLGDLAQVRNTVLAFAALTCMASGTYLINDIWDRAEDRKHWSKRYRPIAAERLSVTTALCVAMPCIGAGVALGLVVSARTGAALLLYLALTLGYTFHLKTVPFVDGLVLAALFTIRLGIGVAAADVPPSPWLFVFSMFLFASLSYAKRHTEIVNASLHRATELTGRGYRAVDAPIVLTVGVSIGIGAVLIMVLYIVEEAFSNSFYGSTGWLWGFPPLVFLFVMRVWLLSARGEMSDDPVAFAIKDRTSIALLVLLLLCFGFAWLG